MHAASDQSGKMRHINEEHRTDFIGNRTEPGEIDNARIGRTTCDNQLGLMLLGQRLDLIEIDQMGLGVHAVLDRIEPFTRLCRARTVGQMATGIKAHAKDRVAWLHQRKHDRPVRLRAHDPHQLNDALRRAIAHDGPVVIEVPMGPVPSPWPFIVMPRVR